MKPLSGRSCDDARKGDVFLAAVQADATFFSKALDFGTPPPHPPIFLFGRPAAENCSDWASASRVLYFVRCLSSACGLSVPLSTGQDYCYNFASRTSCDTYFYFSDLVIGLSDAILD
jgi:hypothetical protein